MGLDVLQPRLSWLLAPEGRRGVRQSAYRVLVASSPELLAVNQGDLWDSGRVESDASVHVQYSGAQLQSRVRCFWKVQIWDDTGAVSEWSEAARWEMGFLDAADWQAEWIASPLAGGHRATLPVPYLRKEFAIEREMVRARLYVTARGLYEFSLNGKKVGDDLFAPGDTDYSKRIQYQVYDVAPLLRPGQNAAGALLGDGWYCGYMAWRQRQYYGERPSLLAQLELEFADGTRSVIVSDHTWKTGFGAILEADFLQGEVYDARREMSGWDNAGFDASSWWNVVSLPDEGAKRAAMRGPTVKRQIELRPVLLNKRSGDPAFESEGPKDPIFDLGQNMVGWVRLKVSAPAGTTLKIRYAEVLDKDGKMYVANLRAARATDYYTCKGGGEEVWEPRFTFHGFRYVELSGYSGEITPGLITGIVLHSEMAPTGEFECSDPLINQLQKNIQWGQRGNFVDIPTDCPQRDERLGWMGDAQVFIRTAAFNFNVAAFFTKWQNDIADSQAPTGEFPMVAPDVIRNHDAVKPSDGGPAWADAGVICPWTIYLCYGDTRLLAEHYESLRRFVGSLKAASLDLIRSHPAKVPWGGFGDWLALDGSKTWEGLTPKDLIGTAFFAHSARLLGRIAASLGKAEDAAEYEALFEAVRAAYQCRYITPGGLVASGTQTAHVLTLHFDLAPESLRAQILDSLVRNIEKNGNKLATGFVGTSYLPHVLTCGGRLDVAYRLLNQKQWPSWLYAVTQGATTIWERWDGLTQDKGFQDVSMNSFNHYAYGAVGEWLYGTVAGLGIDPAAPGYKHVVIKPQPGGGLTHAFASLATGYGKLSSRWEIIGETLRLQVEIPPNTSATVYVPAAQGEGVTEGGLPAAGAPGVEAVGWENGAAVYRVGSGSYQFAARRSA